jgi:ABC-type glycerol-3-phosphate transport system substrate-binding protein
MRKKPILALLVALTMLMSAFFSGCGKKEADNNGNTSAQSSQTSTEKKEIEMSIAMWDIAKFGPEDAIGKKIMDDMKVKINIVQLSWDNDLEQIKLFGASGNMPDFFTSYSVDYDMNRFYSWLDQGLTRTIPEELVNKYPTIKTNFDNSPVLQAVKKITGAYSFIPRPESVKDYYKAQQQGLFYRKDWMANVGITAEPQTVDEFYTMLKAFTFNDPNKNGKADTYGLTAPGSVDGMFAMWGIDPSSWLDENGKIIPAYMSDKMLEPLKYFRKLYSEKILDPEFTKNGYKQAIQKFTTGSFGVMLRNADVHWINQTIMKNFAPANPDITDPLTAVGILGPMKKDANSTPGWPMKINTCATEVNAKVDDEKLDRFLELNEYLMNPDIKNMLRYGFEGVDYKINNGKVEPTVDPATNQPVNIMDKYPSSVVSELSDWDFDNLIDNPLDSIVPQAIKDLGAATREKYNPAALQENFALRYINVPSKETTIINQNDSIKQIIMGKEDVETMFAAFKQDCKDKGIDKVIEEVNAKASELGLK